MVKRGENMSISYNKLWKILIDKKMKKKDLMALANLNTSTLAKMGKDLPVSMEVMSRVCKIFGCDIGDVMEILPDKE
jgi:putative transcriptional regulator